MKYVQSCILAASITVVLCSCSSGSRITFTPVPQSTVEFLWRNPLPTPSIVWEIFTIAEPQLGFEHAICMNINQNSIWEPGDWDGDISRRIQRTAVTRIDGEIVPAVFVEFGTAIGVFAPQIGDEPPERIGSHGGTTSVCFDAEIRDPGVHLASIEFYSRSGIRYEHTWAFMR